MTPDHARDKLDLIQSERSVPDRVAGVFDTALAVVTARFCWTREEAEDAMHIHALEKLRERRARRMDSIIAQACGSDE